MQILRRLYLNYFAIINIFLVSVSLLKPEWFTWLAPYLNYLVAASMFGIGLSHSIDITQIYQYSKGIILCLLIQYSIMPLIALALIYCFQPVPSIAQSLLLIACCPSSNISNITTYLARGNMALSLSATTLSTLLSPIITVVLLYLLTGQWLYLPSKALVTDLFLLIILPVLMGFVLNRMVKNQILNLKPSVRIVTIFTMLAITCTITGLNARNILTHGLDILALIVLYHLLGFLIAYAITQLSALSRDNLKAVVIESSLQNSNLANTLALQFFSPLTALPCTLLSVWHSIWVMLIANYWAKFKSPIIIISRKMTPKNFAGISLYPFIFCADRKYLCDSFINHEKIHIAQQKELLLVGFYILYLSHYLINLIIYRNKQQAYANIVFEKEAYSNENDLDYLKKRRLWAFLTYFSYRNKN